MEDANPTIVGLHPATLPTSGVKAVILALHGFNDYSNAFAMPARLWAERGIASYAYDQRGFGGAPGLRPVQSDRATLRFAGRFAVLS